MLVTNDLDNGTTDIYEAALPGARIVTLQPGQTLKSIRDRFKGKPLVIDIVEHDNFAAAMALPDITTPIRVKQHGRCR